MIRFYTLTSCLIILSLSLNGQITIENKTFPEAGDVFEVVIDNMPPANLDYASGADQTWDFSMLQGAITRETNYLDPQDGDAFASFGEASCLLNFGVDAETYYSTTDEVFAELGFSTIDPITGGFEISGKYDVPYGQRRAPLNFGDATSESSTMFVVIATSDLPDTLVDLIPFDTDSIRFRLNVERTDNTDGWGTLKLPAGEFEVLRQKRVEERDSRLEILLGILWFDITDFVADGSDGFLGTDTTTTYLFMAENIKEPVASIGLDSVGNIGTVAYKDNNINTPVIKLSTGRPDMIASPNPTLGKTKFTVANVVPGRYTIKLYNIIGAPLWSKDVNINGVKTLKQDFSYLRKGTYLYSILNDQGKTLITKRLMILKP